MSQRTQTSGFSTDGRGEKKERRKSGTHLKSFQKEKPNFIVDKRGYFIVICLPLSQN